MLKTRLVVTALALGALSLPALAGSWPNSPVSRAQSTPKMAAQAAAKESPKAVGGFVYTGGEPGWTLAQHKFVLENGTFVHSQECDHAIRSASAGPTPAESEAVKRLSPG